MSFAETFMLYFRVNKEILKESILTEKVYQIGNEFFTNDFQSKKCNINDESLFIIWDKTGRTLILRSYSDGLITVDVQSYISKNSFQNREAYDIAKMEEIHNIEEKLDSILNSNDTHSLLVPIKRGMNVWPYVASSDRRLIETDYDEIVFHKKSKYQTIDIVHSKSCGNCLLLDGDLMIADSDLIYTHTLTGINRGVDYKDKEVLILGGGDGGTLYELLNLDANKPKFIWMAEIDEDVVKACRDHLKKVCFNALDSYEGPNHKILFENCLNTLQRFQNEGKKVDFVINDLTEYPVSKEVTGYSYDFKTCFSLMELSIKILKPNGRLFARGNCIGAVDYFKQWESDVTQLGATFKRIEIFVPSYIEQAYVLYEIIPKQI